MKRAGAFLKLPGTWKKSRRYTNKTITWKRRSITIKEYQHSSYIWHHHDLLQAADANEADNKKQGASQCLLKIATLASSSDDFTRAANIFEQLGTESMSTTLGAYSAKGHFFSALLCYLASGDAVATRSKLERYKNIDHTFPQSRECQLITNLLEVQCISSCMYCVTRVQAVDNFNVEDFSSACADFNKITPLDPWKTSMLLKVSDCCDVKQFLDQRYRRRRSILRRRQRKMLIWPKWGVSGRDYYACIVCVRQRVGECIK